ncbi:MAG: hypothetical protein ACREOH_21965, partial [Candidatus Entotheonellia bacterium]
VYQGSGEAFAENIDLEVLGVAQQFPLMTCESYVTMSADSSLSVSAIRFRLLRRLSRSDMTGCLVASRLLS